MNHITFSSIIYFAELILLAVLILGIAAWKLAKVYYNQDQKRKRQELDYDMAYHNLENQIKECKVSSIAEAIIKAELKNIALLPTNDKEKTGKLVNDYLKKFYGVTEDEFDPGQLDYDRVRREIKIANEFRLL